MKKKLKFYVAERVLEDYSYGLVCIAAYDLDHARQLVCESCIYDGQHGAIMNALREITGPELAYVYGGG